MVHACLPGWRSLRSANTNTSNRRVRTSGRACAENGTKSCFKARLLSWPIGPVQSFQFYSKLIEMQNNLA